MVMQRSFLSLTGLCVAGLLWAGCGTTQVAKAPAKVPAAKKAPAKTPAPAAAGFPAMYGFTFGMDVAGAKARLASYKWLQPATMRTEKNLVIVSARCTQEREVQSQGVRSFELRFSQDQLVGIQVFINGDGGAEWVETKKRMGTFLGQAVTDGQHLIKDYIVKSAANKLDITDVKLGIKLKLINTTVENFREAWKRQSGK